MLFTKKSIVTALLILLSYYSKAQVYEKGDISADVYYGGPDAIGGIFKAAADKDAAGDYADLKVSYTGNIGGRFEYHVSNLVGLGLNVNYAKTTIKGIYTDSDDNSVTAFKWEIPRLRIMPIVTLHLGKSDKLDPYFLFGAGYSNFRSKISSNDPEVQDLDVNIPFYFATRAEFGLKYFITDNIGFHGQVGVLGGGLIAAGVSVKF